MWQLLGSFKTRHQSLWTVGSLSLVAMELLLTLLNWVNPGLGHCCRLHVKLIFLVLV